MAKYPKNFAPTILVTLVTTLAGFSFGQNGISIPPDLGRVTGSE